MNEAQDPLLADKLKTGSGIRLVPSQNFSFPSIPDNVTRLVAAYTQLIWDLANLKKTQSTTNVIENTAAFFSNPELRAADKLWMNHCASSLRELGDNHFEVNCLRFLNCLPKRGASSEALQIYSRLGLMKEWLGKFAHLKDSDTTLMDDGSTLVSAAQLIIKQQDIKVIDEIVFDKACSAFIFELHGLFKKCTKGTV